MRHIDWHGLVCICYNLINFLNSKPMNTYKIEIQELLSKVIEIEASSAEEAIDKAREMYRAEEIVLDADDWVGTEIKEFDE